MLWTYSTPPLGALARLYRRTALRTTRVVAVVGSFGKTATTRAIRAALGLGNAERLPGNYDSALYLDVLKTRPGQRRAAFEVGINGFGDMRRLARVVQPDIAVVTGIGSEHRRTFKTVETTREEKADCIRALRRGGVTIVYGDDPHAVWMGGQATGRVVTFGLSPELDVWADEIRLDWPAGTAFKLHVDGQTRWARTRLLGRHQVRAALAAAAVAWVEGLELEAALERLAMLTSTPGRLQPVALANGAVVLRDEFKSPVETIDAALDLLAEIPARRKTVVLGMISEPPSGQARVYRRIGERVATVADRLITFGEGRDYGIGARRAGLPQDAVTHVRFDLGQVTKLLEAELGPGDVVLVKGRGAQRMERIVLGLQGRKVGCRIETCRATNSWHCGHCPILERGWGDSRVLP